MKRSAELVFISWAEDCSRSDGIAKRLGGASHMVYARIWGSRYSTILFKYLWQSVKTLRILFRERPRVVFVMTPPVIASFPVWLYTRITGGTYAIDAHTGAFLDPRWTRVLFLHKFFSRRAVTTLVTNDHLKGLVESWQAKASIVSDVPVDFAEPRTRALEGATNMTLVSTYTMDEPIDLFLEAARRVPNVHFYVTGNYEKADPEILKRRPENVTLTGFLSHADYAGLLLASDAVIALTTLDHTMQRGAYEAVYLGKPVITSNFPVLRASFDKGTVHVDNTVRSIADGIRQMRDNVQMYTREAKELRREKLERWERVAAQIRELLGVDAASSG